MFGGGLNTVWPFAVVALHYLDGFSQRYASRGLRELIKSLGAKGVRSNGSRPARTCFG
jgi:hypothetical protein